jgi:hypothetical protein
VALNVLGKVVRLSARSKESDVSELHEATLLTPTGGRMTKIQAAPHPVISVVDVVAKADFEKARARLVKVRPAMVQVEESEEVVSLAMVVNAA